jgi:hypothetical protein
LVALVNVFVDAKTKIANNENVFIVNERKNETRMTARLKGLGSK